MFTLRILYWEIPKDNERQWKQTQYKNILTNEQIYWENSELMQVSSSKSKFSLFQFYKKVIENLANHKTQDSYFYDASDEVDKS
jgi:hypothetical protein